MTSNKFKNFPIKQFFSKSKLITLNKYCYTDLNIGEYHISQTNSFDEDLILVEENDKKIGSIKKLDGI